MSTQPTPMKANEVRKAFTDFFVERAHSHQPSASLIPHDPTLLFTVAGMVPFKTYFTGEETPPFPRAVTVQKCVRAGGKHNDLDEIGRTKRHLTFFEMMGNFSFGDYFKEDACAWAWEFVTEVIGLPADRLWVTVHLTDDEAADIWENQVGVPADRIQRLDEDNYWKMGDVGPCGPCSEIFWDKGPAFGADGGPEHGDEDRFIEIWNLVFMQFDQQADGSKVPLPKPSIDTGMGLERTVSVLQGVDSVWDTDELFALQAAAAKLTGIDPATAEFEQLVSLRILADHARSTSLLVSDGVFPSNEARGYVLRRILRRAVRHAYILGVESAVMGGMVDAVIEIMGADYPDLAANHQFVREVIDREEVRFRETLRKGQSILDEQLDALADGAALPGDVAFLLHDTYGFPLEVTQEITGERGVEVDEDGFRAAMAEQQRLAKEARKVAAAGDTGHLTALVDEHGETDFTGRDETSTEATVLYVDDDTLVLDRTPFYAESGGQIGDTGTVTGGGVTIDVTDPAAARLLVDRALERFGRLDVMYANAGGAFPTPFEKSDVDYYRRTIALNLDAVWQAAQASVPVFVENGGGVFLATSSGGGINAVRGLTAYGAAKAGVQSLVKGLALEYGALGVRANAIAPGPIESPGILAWLATRPGGVDEHVKDHPMRRMGKPEEIAAAAAFLASDDASYVNGITIPVDGGKQATL